MAETSQNNRQKKCRRSSGWSPERRAKHAAAIQKWKPWEKSTGPKTVAGKATASQNAYKHGFRGAEWMGLLDALAAQKRYVQHVIARQKIYLAEQRLQKLAAKNKNVTNKLLNAPLPVDLKQNHEKPGGENPARLKSKFFECPVLVFISSVSSARQPVQDRSSRWKYRQGIRPHPPRARRRYRSSDSGWSGSIHRSSVSEPCRSG